MKSHSFSLTQDHFVHFGIALFFFLAASFLVIRFVPFFFTPKMSIINPARETIIVDGEMMRLLGEAKFTSLLTVNGEKVYIAKTGAFEIEVKLEEGMNLFVFQARNRFGRKVEVVKRVVFIRPL